MAQFPKKVLMAAEQDRPDVAVRRDHWRQNQQGWNPALRCEPETRWRKL